MAEIMFKIEKFNFLIFIKVRKSSKFAKVWSSQKFKIDENYNKFKNLTSNYDEIVSWSQITKYLSKTTLFNSQS